MPRHIIDAGDLSSAQLLLTQKGGQLYPARDSHGPFVITRGSIITTLWPPNSPRRGKVIEMARTLEYDPHIATTGRLVRHLLDDIVRLEYKPTYFEPKWRGLAEKGNHWHYLHCVPGSYEYCIEIDLVSAYWTALMTQPSILLSKDANFLDDGGALSSLNSMVGLLPKAFRLALVGSIASWRQTYFVRDKNDPTNSMISTKTRHEIKYGAAFNAVHRAILKVWKVMEICHKIVGKDCVRIHTDGITVNAMNGMAWERQLEDFILSQGFDYTVKAQGNTWINDVNSAIVGRKVIGVPSIVAREAKERGIKINLNAPAPHSLFLKVEELPTPPTTEVNMVPAWVETQTSLPFII